MKKLRLLFTHECNRACKMCSNKYWDVNNLPTVEHFNYDEILITGGEPLLFIQRLIGLITAIRVVSDAKIYVYTAWTGFVDLNNLLKYVDGIALTFHEKNDANHATYSSAFRNLDKDSAKR